MNIVGYQIVWLVAVWGAGHGLWWPAFVAMPLFVALVLAHRGRRADLLLMATVVPLGCAMDSILAASGWLHYAAPVPSAHLAPLWIVAIWCCFALTLRHTFRFLFGRPALAAVFGGVGAPLAYLAAARGWDAVRFGTDAFPGMAALVLMWAAALPFMLHLARRFESRASTETGVRHA
nr:DUF2878 domain-containing protein [Oleiagrimonas soli]